MDPRIKELRLMRWKEIIVACNTSGMSKKAWMEANHINSKSFYRMQKAIREYELDKMELPKLSEVNPGASGTQFVDVTKLIKSPENTLLSNRTASENTITPLQAEMMLQVGQYNLYIGSGVTDATLKTVLGVISRA